jgi:hypothetical protein
VELEKENLLVKLNDSSVLIDKLKLDITVLNEQNKSLENELNASKDLLKKFYSDKPDKVLSVQRFMVINLDLVLLVIFPPCLQLLIKSLPLRIKLFLFLLFFFSFFFFYRYCFSSFYD